MFCVFIWIFSKENPGRCLKQEKHNITNFKGLAGSILTSFFINMMMKIRLKVWILTWSRDVKPYFRGSFGYHNSHRSAKFTKLDSLTDLAVNKICWKFQANIFSGTEII